MDICPPAIATAAAFVAVILLNLYNQDYRRVPGHALLGTFAVLLMIFLCQRTADWVAWVLLGAPFVFVLIAWIVRSYQSMDHPDDIPEQSNPYDPGCPCPCCGSVPCHCMRACPEPRPCKPKPKPKNSCRPKNPPCNEDSYFELWLTTK